MIPSRHSDDPAKHPHTYHYLLVEIGLTFVVLFHRIPTGRNGKWRRKRQGTAGDRGFRSGSAPERVEEASTLRKEPAIKQGTAMATMHNSRIKKNISSFYLLCFHCGNFFSDQLPKLSVFLSQ